MQYHIHIYVQSLNPYYKTLIQSNLYFYFQVSVNSPAANVIDFNHINVVSPVATFQDLVSADYFGDQSA